MAERKDEWVSGLVRNNAALRKALIDEQGKRIQATSRVDELEKEINALKSEIASERMQFKADKKILLQNMAKSISLETRSAIEELAVPVRNCAPIDEDIDKKLQKKFRITARDVEEILSVYRGEIEILKMQITLLTKKSAKSSAALLLAKRQLDDDIRELTELLIKKTAYSEGLIFENESLKLRLSEQPVENVDPLKDAKKDDLEKLVEMNQKLNEESELLQAALAQKYVS
jgi:hypothetical protein